MAYLPLTDAERGVMLAAIGVSAVDDLFASIPEPLRRPPLELPPPLSEPELAAELAALAQRNRPLSQYRSFLGAGVYDRFIPALVRATVGRPEFYTAYTPYQAEASQGTLQTIFEFQSMICALTGLEVANASLYDGATATAEAALLAVTQTGRRRIALSAGLHPETRRVLATYAAGRGVALDPVALVDDRTDAARAGAVLTSEHAAFIVAQPTFLGTLEHLAPLADAAHRVGALAIAAVDPLACAALVPPGEAGFDVAVGDGQPLGVAASFGGPHVGFIAARKSLVRRLPGRLVGMTVDAQGRRAYALTLQAREQHIRRQQATSNICTNHALVALAATAYMAHMGAGGMRRVAEISAQRAHHLAGRLTALPGFRLASETPFLWEFALRCPLPAAEMVRVLRPRGLLAGFDVGRVDAARADTLLVCCTETTAPAAMDDYVEAVQALVGRVEEVTA